MILKIADFGLSYELMQEKSRASTRAGTQIYWPPEVWAGESPSKQTDIYSVGCIFYELCLGNSHPATSLMLFERKPQLLKDLSPQIGEEGYLLISAMVDTDQIKRPSFELILYLLKNKKSFQSLYNEH